MSKRLLVLAAIQVLFLSAAWADENDQEHDYDYVGLDTIMSGVKYRAYLDSDGETVHAYVVSSYPPETPAHVAVHSSATFTRYTIDEQGNEITHSRTYTVDSVGSGVFACNDSVVSVSLPGTAKKMGSSVFSGCHNLKNVTLPTSLKFIPSEMFANSSIEAVNGGSIDVVGSSAFYNCKNLSGVPVGTLAIIGTSAFSQCTSLGSILLLNHTKIIGASAFSGCTNLSLVSIFNEFDAVVEVGDGAFVGCTSLRELWLDCRQLTLGVGAFGSCDALTEVRCWSAFPPSSTEPFQGTPISKQTALFTYFPSNYKDTYPWKYFHHIYGLAFDQWLEYKCNSFRRKACVTGPARSNRTAQSARGLRAAEADETCLKVPETIEVEGDEYIVNAIGSYAFYGNEELSSVLLPATIDTIGEGAFARCANLTEFLCYAHEVPIADANAFDETPVGDATLIVQPSLVDAYKATAPWNEFGAIVALDDASSVDEVISEKVDDPSWVDLQGRRYTSRPSHPGWYIHGNKKMVVSH